MFSRRVYAILWAVLLVVGLAPAARAIDQAMPSDHPPIGEGHGGMGTPISPAASEPSEEALAIMMQDRTAFQQAIKLDKFRMLAIQNQDQVKIIDSWARQTLKKITNRETWEGQDPVYTAMDMALRPEAWNNENIIFVQAVPVREQLMAFGEGANDAERIKEGQRILKEGLISPRFMDRPEVQEVLERISLDVRKSESVGKISLAQSTLNDLFIKFDIAPPGVEQRGMPWLHPASLAANALSPKDRETMKTHLVPGYSAAQAGQIETALREVILGWRTNDAAQANQGLATFAAVLPTIDPAGYPSHVKRVTELWYNRTFYGTIANVFLYFIAMTLFLLVSVGVSPKLWRYAYIIFSVAVVLHLTSMGIRFWLAERWPTQNEFESVLGAALLGCCMGWCLETWRKSGLFGMAFSFVGFLAMTACMAAPYMFGTDLGGAIGKTAGILQTYWLYIHVNIVISSYALISASFILGALYLMLRQWYWVNPLEPGDEGGAANALPAMAGGSGPATMPGLSLAAVREMESARAATLGALDQANMVILQMAFWFLGIGIICGAVWADHSWGRPWGWDPKETFALITWIVYLIIVHVRIISPNAKADKTAWLSILGFAIMMFNWIGVNFFLAGLHSYA